jgi:hypothetical protein
VVVAEQVIHFHPSKPAKPQGRLEKIGLFLRKNRRLIIAIQWVIVVLYAAMVIIPAFLPLPPEDAHIWDNLRLFAQFCFWGLWWPGVMIATVTMGRVWCGLFCPEGALSEWVSQYGRGKALPRWLKWTGWPFVAFVMHHGVRSTGQRLRISASRPARPRRLDRCGARHRPALRPRKAHLVPLPVPGLRRLRRPRQDRPAALQGRPRRLGRHQGDFEPVNCAPLLDVRRMTSASECHSCGRCAGQRDAVTYSARSPFAEILDLDAPAKTPDALTLVYGVLGVATAAFQWTLSPWLLNAKLALAEWLVDHDHFLLLDNDVPWWLLTHYPEASDLFTWLDGVLILGYLLGGGFLLGSLLLIGPAIAARLLKTEAPDLATLHPRPHPARRRQRHPRPVDAHRQPPESRTYLARLAALFPHRMLTAGCLGSLWLAFQLVLRSTGKNRPKIPSAIAGLAMLWPVGLMATVWTLVFFVW